MLNHIVMMGRLTRDPEVRRLKEDTPVASFTIACDRDFGTRENGDKIADFVDIVAWRGTAEFAEKYLSKGRMVVVSGRLQIRAWTDKDGNKRSTTEIVADNIYPCDQRRSTDETEKPTRQRSSGSSGGYSGGRSRSAYEGDPGLPF